MARVTGLAASVLLHAVLAAPLMVLPVQAELDSHPLPAPVLELLDLDSGDTLAESPDRATDCAQGRLFLGIGIQFKKDRVILAAPESYPAFQSGLRVGDRVVDPNIEPDDGGYMTVEFERQGKRHRLHIRSRWICSTR
jgi:hypothetical protein